MSPRMNERELLSRLADLPREISPGRDPWPEIATEIGKTPAGFSASKSRANWWPLAAAASVILAISAGLVMNSLYREGPVSTDFIASGDPATTAVEAAVVQNTGTFGILEIVDAEYVAAFRELTNTGGSNDDLAPQTVEKIEMGWADLRTTEAALMAALEENPNNRFLNERMLELRARQLGFLKQLVSLDRKNRRLTI